MNRQNQWEMPYRDFTKSKMNMQVLQKVRFSIFYLNNITTHRITHGAEVQSHISFTSPRSHQVCLDTYCIYISISQVLHKKCVLGMQPFLDSVSNIIIGAEALRSEMLFSSLGIHGCSKVQIKNVRQMWKNFPVPGFQEIHGCGSTVKLSVVQKNYCFGLFCQTAFLSLFRVS